MAFVNYEHILEIYSLEDILELNDWTEAELLEYLVEDGLLKLPEHKQLEFE